MIFKTITLLAAIGTMSACSSSSSGSGGGDFDDQRQNGLALIEELGNEELTPEAAMPTSGTATYNGTAGFVPDASRRGVTLANLEANDLEVLADLEMTADFGAGSVTGRIDNFNDFALGPLAGSASIDNGTITGSGISADVNGSISVEGDTEALVGTMNGAFVGANAGGVIGTLEGTAGSGPGSSSDFVGVFGGRSE